MRIAIVGSGKIVVEVLGVFDNMPEVEVVSVFAREHSREKAEALAAQHGIAEVYTDYGQMLRSVSADYVYVCLVNSAHYDYAAQAIEAGFNVIVEKPMCPTKAETASLAELSRQKGVLLVEAVTLLHMSAMRAIENALAGIGPIVRVESSYCQYSSRYDRYLQGDVAPVFDVSLKGGALMDLNVYNVNFVVWLFGLPQGGYSYAATRGYNGIDIDGTVRMNYGDFVAECIASKHDDGPSYGIVEGEHGRIEVEGPVSTLRRVTIDIDGERRVLEQPECWHRMQEEFREFDRILRDKDRGRVERLLAQSEWVAEIVGKAWE